LLDQLISLKRRYEIALARGNKIELNELLADDYLTTEKDADEAVWGDKKDVLAYEKIDPDLFSYSVANEELIERTAETAAFSCIGCFTRHNAPTFFYEDGIEDRYYRTIARFVRRGGRWQIKNFREVPVDENGKDL